MENKSSHLPYLTRLAALLLLFGTLGQNVCAANQTVKAYVFDLNTRGGIVGANATIWFNQTDANYSVYTDPYGYAEYVEYDYLPIYRLTITHPNYISYDTNITAPGPNSQTVYLYPKASAGIIRLRFQDRMPGWNTDDRELCIFYKENMRLYQCMKTNETAQLLTQKEYVLVPTIQAGDMLTSRENITNFLYIYGGVILSGLAFGLAALLIFAYLIVSTISKAWRNKK